MFQRASVVLVVFLALSGMAYAADNAKSSIDSFAPVNGENPTADGRAILHYKSSDDATNIQIMLDDFTPNTVYDVQFVSQTMGEAAACDVITTDSQGRAHYKISLAGNWTDAGIGILISDDCSFSDDEYRAVSN